MDERTKRVQRRLSFNRRSIWALVSAPVLALAGLSVIAAGPAQAHTSAPAVSHILKPNKTNNLDCNAWSTAYKSIAPAHRMLCADPHGPLRSRYSSASHAAKKVWSRFIDNGHYVGHDEPSVKFISSTAGSGNTMTYFMRLPHDPRKKATNDGKVVDAAELSPAIWFGLPLCDPKSYPQNPCTPDSDYNLGVITNPADAGSAFMELQLYGPGFAPFNNNCIEPVNFAFLQMNGVPAGPPSPQLADVNTFTPNRQTLEMNQGDTLVVSIRDTSQGLLTRIDDLSTGRSGFMVASAANGFMNTNIADCSGTPFT